MVSDSAFSVPPQQLITNDGGIIEVRLRDSDPGSQSWTRHRPRILIIFLFAQIGAEVQYGITDVVVMVREVADHQDILR